MKDGLASNDTAGDGAPRQPKTFEKEFGELCMAKTPSKNIKEGTHNQRHRYNLIINL